MYTHIHTLSFLLTDLDTGRKVRYAVGTYPSGSINGAAAIIGAWTPLAQWMLTANRYDTFSEVVGGGRIQRWQMN